MCIICVEFSAGKLTREEGLRNLREMAPVLPGGHVSDVELLLSSICEDVSTPGCADLNCVDDWNWWGRDILPLVDTLLL